MQVEFKNKIGEILVVQSLDTIGDIFSESVIVHSGRTDKETSILWDLIEDALSKDITIICREKGYYILSRKAT